MLVYLVVKEGYSDVLVPELDLDGGTPFRTLAKEPYKPRSKVRKAKGVHGKQRREWRTHLIKGRG